MITTALRAIANRIPRQARRQIHHAADGILNPLGSVSRASKPTDYVALTFDDGPDSSVTPRLLDLLRERKVHATFFVLTDYAVQLPMLTRRIVEEGHELALHGDRHDRLTRVPRGLVKARLSEARRILEDVGGTSVNRLRTPYGAQALPTIITARRLGFELVVWGPTAQDWVEQSAANAADHLLRQVRGGDIALLHDGLEIGLGEVSPTFDRVEMVRLVLNGLDMKGLKPTSVARMVDAAGAYRTFWVRP
jgi:peptidoglycan/xylan/chitin deacetylase (PgdA/CDA1 family)